MTRPYIDFYEEHKLIPSRVSEGQLDLHFARRDAIYRHLGLVSSYLKGLKIIEFGPGSGDNAVHTASFGPDTFTLVDGHSVSIEELERKKKNGNFSKVNTLEIIKADILEYDDDRKFDLVLCEGVIPRQLDAPAFARHVANFTAPGGVCVVSAHSPISELSETCRRIVKPLMQVMYPEFTELKEVLTNFFEPDLMALKGFSRNVDEWVLDNILHPVDEKMFFSIPDAIAALADGFDVYGCSPHMIADWRWHKSIPESGQSYNGFFLDQYMANQPLLVDSSLQPSDCDLSACDGHMLADKCRLAFDIHMDIWPGTDLSRVPEFMALIESICVDLAAAMPASTPDAFRDYLKCLNAIMDGDPAADLGRFKGLFGRGQQYLSFIRRL